jgi:hypothetical protein
VEFQLDGIAREEALTIEVAARFTEIFKKPGFSMSRSISKGTVRDRMFEQQRTELGLDRTLLMWVCGYPRSPR